MKRGLGIVFFFLIASTTVAQIRVDLFRVPALVQEIEVSAERELFMVPLRRDTICFSSDHGESWSVITVPTIWQFRPVRYQLSTQQGGKALLAFQEWNAARDTFFVALLVTADTGRTWNTTHFVVTDRLPLPMNADIRDYRLCDDSTIYLRSDASVFRSTDIGASWHAVPELQGMRDLRFIRSRLGCAQKTLGDSAIIVTTTDGGSSWKSDTLGWKIGRLQLQYDGSMFASVHSTEDHPISYFAPTIGAAWERIDWPSGEVTAGIDLSWNELLYLGNTQFVARAADNMAQGYLFLTQDGGGRWTRLHFSSPRSTTTWEPWTTHATSAWRTGLQHFALSHPQDSLFVIQVPLESPMHLRLENFSTGSKLQALLSWSDPFLGHTAKAVFERSGADSNWIEVGQNIPAGQQYLDSTLTGGGSVRYRVTLDSDDGRSAAATSDSMTFVTGPYVDLLDYLLPGSDRLLHYAVRNITGHATFGTPDTTDLEVSMLFLPSVDSTATIRLHPVRKITRAPSGANDTTYGRIIEYLDLYHHFRDEAYPLLSEYLELPWVWSYYCPGPKYKGMVDISQVDPRMIPWEVRDSVFLYTRRSSPPLFHTWNSYTAVSGIGIREISISEETFHTHFYLKSHWRLIDHVNETENPPQPLSGLSLHSFPNPVASTSTVRFNLPTAGEIVLTVHDLLGRRVRTLVTGSHGAGEHIAAFNSSGLNPGLYLLSLQQGTRKIVRKMLIL